jgi:hypothetical protein
LPVRSSRAPTPVAGEPGSVSTRRPRRSVAS